jgi:leucyl aminopeptidase
MKIRWLAEKAAPARGELVVALAFDGPRPKLPLALDGAAKKARATGDLQTGFRKWSLFYPANGAKRLGFVGMGKPDELTAERLRQVAAIAQERAEDLGVAELQLRIAPADYKGLDAAAAGAAVAEGLLLGAYRYQPPGKKQPEPRKAQRAVIVHAGGARGFGEGVRLGIAGAAATAFARDLGNKPGNECTPNYLAAQARKLAGAGVRVTVLGQREMERYKMGALLGVARGSSEPPKLIVLDYKPAGATRTVCVVGKGLTFDSGGISIKPSARMDEMRYDMCGGAAVLGLFHAIRAGALRGARGKARIVGLVAAAENMPDAAAQKPGDVVRACDGTTIEVLNTDAEGRLVLADALAWACKTYRPDKIVDLATLTGAVIVALGHEASGIMGNDDDLVRALIEAGKQADEPLWQLPLWDVHKEQMKSKFADLANINGPNHGNGPTAGAAFLVHFVGEVPWAHLDIAGTAWGARPRDYYRTGATGAPVRTLLRWVRSLR